MGLQLPQSARRISLGVLGLTLLTLGACSGETKEQAERFAMPASSPATVQGEAIAALWKWSWVAALITGVIVWGLIFWVAARYRRRSDDEVPVQTRYNLPLEIFYTVAPIMMVIVLFYHTVNTQNIALDKVDDPDVTVEVVGQQWSWTFNYPETGPQGENVFTSGTASQIPTLVLPVDKTVQFNLHSPDVIHSFWITGFLMKMDVVPGRVNNFQVHTTKEGTFRGKCTELCGVYHSRMLFNVEVVSEAEYEKFLADQAAKGFTSDAPLLGGSEARTQAGLGNHTSEGGH